MKRKVRVLLLHHPSPELPGMWPYVAPACFCLGLAVDVQRPLRQGHHLCEERWKPRKLWAKPCGPVTGAEPQRGCMGRGEGSVSECGLTTAVLFLRCLQDGVGDVGFMRHVTVLGK